MRSFSTFALVFVLCALPSSAQIRVGSVVDAPAAAVDAALQHVQLTAAQSALGPIELVASGGHTSLSGHASYVYIQQQVAGVDVERAVVSVTLDPAGRIVHVAGDLIRGVPGFVTTPAPSLSAAQAAARAAGHVGLNVAPTLRESASTPDRAAVLTPASAGGEPTTAHLVYATPTGFADGGALRLAWAVVLDVTETSDRWRVLVDAQSGAVLETSNMVVHCTFGTPGGETAEVHAAHGNDVLAPVSRPLVLLPESHADPLAALTSAANALAGSYLVYPMPVETPIHTTPLPPGEGRVLVVNPADPLASPFGWHDTNGAAGAEFTVTRGNNAHAGLDRVAPDGVDPGSEVEGGPGLLFNPTSDLGVNPLTNQPPAIVNLFYWTNLFHDVLYRYGFTEAAGNFQVNNYGRGGIGGDDVRAEAQDNSGTNNANFLTPADGGRGRMQMYLWNLTTPGRDGSFSNDIIVHEYGHGLSIRLTGGPSNVSCLDNSEQMGEGWSDYYALMLTARATDTPGQRRGIGTWVQGQTTTGTGIRPAPYSTDFAINDWTYGHTRPVANGGRGPSVPHGIGFVWATILWEATQDMIAAHGFSPDFHNAGGAAGNLKMMRLVTEAMKMQPCSPGFVDGRNAILAADALLYPDAANPGRGLHYTTLWNAFARRGLGISATQGSTNSNADNTESFDVPLPVGSAVLSPGAFHVMLPPSGTTSRGAQLTNTAPSGSGSLAYTAQVANLTFVPQARTAAPMPLPASSPTGEIALHVGDPVEAKMAAAAIATASPAGAPDALGAGGPDAFGYQWDDSNEPGGPAVAFQDISGTGTAITTWTATGTFDPRDEGYADVALPFAFPYYGITRNSVRVNTNGFLHFSTHAANAFTNLAVPATSLPNSVIAPFWDDLDMSQAAGGTVYTGTLPDGRFVVQFHAVKGFSQASSSYTFQVILSASGVIEVQYGTMTGSLTSATVGIENDAGTVGLGVVFNAAYVASNKALRFRAGRQWVNVTGGAGVLVPGASASFSVDFDATGLTEGTYTADLVITSNEAGSPASFPVSLTVGGSGVVAGSAGWRLLAAPATGLTVDDLAVMNLVQGVPGFYPPPQAQPNLLTGYDGTAFSSGGTGTALVPGRGFFWYFYNQNLTPGGPSNSYVLPTTLATTQTPLTVDAPVALHGAGTRMNMLGNPFGTSLDVSAMATWPGAAALQSSVAQMWDAASSSYVTSVTRPVIAPWQGFWVYATPTAGALTIPASARTTGGVLQRTAGAAAEALVAFELAEANGERLDQAAVLVFGEAFADGEDLGDAPKLAPPAEAHVLLAIGEGDALRAVESRPLAPTTVPLAVASVGAAADLVLRWPRVEGLPETWVARLSDRVTGQVIDLAATTAYAFSVAPGPARATLAPENATGAVVPARFDLYVGPRGMVATEGGGALELALEAVRPNPASGTATVRVSLPTTGPATVVVADALGREVARLIDGSTVAGTHALALDTRRLAPGVYVVRLTTGDSTLVQRFTVVR